MEISNTSVENLCFICDHFADPFNDNGVFALNAISKKSGKDYYSLIQNIIGDQYKLTFVETDVICQTCTLLIEELDALQKETTTITMMLNRQLYRKYNIVNKFQRNEEDIFDNMILYSPGPNLDSYKYSDNLVCKECNIMFNDNYQLQTHNNELHIEDPLSNHLEYLSDENQLLESLNSNSVSSNHSHSDIIELKIPLSYIENDTISSKIERNTSRETVEATELKLDNTPKDEVVLDIILPEIKRSKKKFSKHKLNSPPNSDDLITSAHCEAELQSNKTVSSHDDSIKSGLKKNTCKLCNAVFSKSNLMLTHMREFHFTCRHCNEQFDTLKNLTKHESSHKHKTKHECSWCCKVFNTKYGLIYHIPKHTGQYKYYCKICNRGFMHSKFLEEHMGVHTKADKYICDICGRKFSFNATYRLHRLWHDKPYPYECKDCGKKFKHTSVLSVHRKTVHTGERPHSCTVCNKAFVASSTLKRHMMIHTGDYRYKCTICDKGYTAKQKYGKHMAKVHNDFTLMNDKNVCEYRMAIPPSSSELPDDDDDDDDDDEDEDNNITTDCSKKESNRKNDEILLNYVK